VAADNVIASMLGRSTKHYYYRDRGLLVDLSGRDAVARPFGVEFNGTAALALTRAYHLYSLPSGPARMRVAANWLIQALLGCDVSRLGFLNRSVETLVDVEEYSRYLKPEQAKERVGLAVGG
jgi:NADH dehydrogenase